MTQELRVWIPTNRRYRDGRPKAMDGLNEIIADNRAHRNKGARIERENVEWCSWYVIKAMRMWRWKPMRDKESAAPVKVFVTFVEANDKRDVSNIVGGGLKYLLDALSRPRGSKGGASAIYDDSSRWLKQITPTIRIDPEAPGIYVTITRED